MEKSAEIGHNESMNRREMSWKTLGCVFGIAVVAAMFGAMIVWARQTRDMLSVQATAERAETLSSALRRFLAENERFPALETSADLKAALWPRYVTAENVFVSARGGHQRKYPFLPNPYLSRKSSGQISNFASVIAVYEQTPEIGSVNERQRAVGFLVGGDARYIQPDEWPILKAQSNIP